MILKKKIVITNCLDLNNFFYNHIRFGNRFIDRNIYIQLMFINRIIDAVKDCC
jgi:hypothetical protein